jgi:hypothetical protein
MAIPALQLPFGRTAARLKKQFSNAKSPDKPAATPNGGREADLTDCANL